MNPRRSLAVAALVISTILGATGSAGAIGRASHESDHARSDSHMGSATFVLPENPATPPGVPIPYPSFVRAASARR